MTQSIVETASPLDIDREQARIDAALDVENFNRRSPYNVAGYRPVHTELRHAAATVSGRLPADLEGVYIRNGTNVQFERSHNRLHAFGGAGMLHAVQIRDGAALYSNTFIRTPRFEAEYALGREVFPDFSDVVGAGRLLIAKQALLEARARLGQVPKLGRLERTSGATSIRFHEGRLYCLQESGYAFRLHTEVENGRLVLTGRGELETWRGRWEGPFSAHPRVDPKSGELYNLSIDPDGRVIAARLVQGRLAAQSVVFEQTREQGLMGWLHDFFLTENFLVFADVSLRFDPAGLFGPQGSMFRFDAGRRMRFGVLPRNFEKPIEVRWFETDAASTLWHVINGWERTSASGATEIVLYAPVFSDYPADLPIHTPAEPEAVVKKWVLNLGEGKVTEERVLLAHHYERPSFNLGYVGVQSRFAYLLDESSGYMGKGVLKYDLIDEAPAGYFDYGAMLGGEALFVPRKGSTREDDGYLIDLLMADDRADLIVIDAATMTELARVHLPQRVPFGVHATWLDNADIASL
ncbi:MAG: carotenoid oxygenase family protein [Polyangiaceae bacterium]